MCLTVQRYTFFPIYKKTKPPPFLAGASFITKLRSIGLEVEVAFTFTYLAEVAFDAFLEVFFAEGLGKLLEEAQAFFLGVRRRRPFSLVAGLA